MSRYLITGGSGFVGQALARAIRARGDKVIVAGRGRRVEHDAEWVEYDLKDRGTIANLIEAKPDGIFHLAWSTTPGSAESDPYSDIQTNVAGSVALFSDLAEHFKVPLVFVSSGGTVYGETVASPIAEDAPLRPIGSYGLGKATVEKYAMQFREYRGLDARVVRLSNPFGPMQSGAKQQGAVTIFARKIINGEPIQVWGDGEIVRDYIFVDDAASGILGVMDADLGRVREFVFNVGSGSGVSLKQLIEKIGTLAGATPVVEYYPARKFDVRSNVLDTSLLRDAFGWEPKYTLDQALISLIRHIEVVSE